MDYVNGIPALAMDDAVSDVPLYTNELRDALAGDGWRPLPITDTTNFAAWDVATSPQIRRVGPMVQIVGALRCLTADYLIGNTDRTFAVLPADCFPAFDDVSRRQGSSDNSWQLRVNPDGTCRAARYGPAASHGTGTWLPFSATWFTA